MPFVPLEGSTGFEAGHIDLIDTADRSTTNTDYVNITAAAAHTGSYGLRIRSENWAQRPIATTPAELYLGVWCKPEIVEVGYDPWSKGRIQIIVDGSAVVELRNDASRYWDAYVNGVKVADGSIQAADNWHSIQLYVLVDNSGVIQTKIDGVDDIDYSGDTQPGAATAIDYVRFFAEAVAPPHSIAWWFDDFVVGTGDWPGDVRFVICKPDGDDTAEWDSTGGDNYTEVDEVPYNDSDYVYTSASTNPKDKYTVEDYSAGGQVRFTVDFIRAMKTAAESGVGVQLVQDVGGSESTSGSIPVSTTMAYYSRVVASNPAGGDWTDAAVDSLKIGQVGVIPA